MENYIMVAEATQLERASFFRKTYTHVALAILAFIVVETILINVVPSEAIAWMMSGKFVWLFFIGLFWLGSILAEKLVFSLDTQKQYMGLAAYVFLEAILFLPLIAIAIYQTGSFAVVLQAAVLTLFLFSGLTAVVFFTKTNFSFLRTALIVAGFVALGLMVAGAIFGFNLGLWFSVVMVLVASGSILYQTHQIKNEFATHQYVGASLQLFASIMLLFWYILRILLNRD